MCASAGAGASGLILWNNFTFEQPSQASSALSLRVVAFLSFASLAGSGLLWLLSIFGDLCCLVPDVTLFSDGTQRYLRRRAPPVFFVDIKIAFSALFICAYLGSLIPYSVMAGGNGFYQLTCSSQAGTLARYCTSAKATLGLAAVAGGCWLVYLVWLVWQRRWAALEGGRSAIKGAV